jgi:hypothetical protein
VREQHGEDHVDDHHQRAEARPDADDEQDRPDDLAEVDTVGERRRQVHLRQLGGDERRRRRQFGDAVQQDQDAERQAQDKQAASMPEESRAVGARSEDLAMGFLLDVCPAPAPAGCERG